MHQVPNMLKLRREQLPKQILDKHRGKRKTYHLYATAAKLWANGMDWSTALDIVSNAFDAVLTDE
jgi:hypothetical protein